MKSLDQIVEQNKETLSSLPYTDQCHVSNVPLLTGSGRAVIIYSAASEATRFIDLTDLFKVGYLRAVCAIYDVDFDLFTSEHWNQIPYPNLMRVIESYWGHYPSPDIEDFTH